MPHIGLKNEGAQTKIANRFFFSKWFCWKVVFVGTPQNEKFGNTKPLKMVYYLVRKVINTTHHKQMLLYWLWLCFQRSFATERNLREETEHNRHNPNPTAIGNIEKLLFDLYGASGFNVFN